MFQVSDCEMCKKKHLYAEFLRQYAIFSLSFLCEKGIIYIYRCVCNNMGTNTRGENIKMRIKKKYKRVMKYYQLYLLLLPALIYFIIFRYGPMYGLQIAFKDYVATKGFAGSPFVGLKHFQRFFSSPDFWIILKNTVSISVGSILVNFPMAIIVALLLHQVTHTRYKKVIQTVIYAPHFISVVVLVGMLTLFLSPTSGIINKIIETFGGEAVFSWQNQAGSNRFIFCQQPGKVPDGEP